MALLSTILNIIYFIVVLGVLVFVHELGHFMAARSIGLPVITFSIGMGPALKKWKWKRFGDTEFRISAVPFGGYCMVSGEEEDTEEDNTYYSKTPWQRIWYCSAGVLMNFALAIVVFIFSFAVFGIETGINETNQMGISIPGFPADKAGIETFDRILSIDGEYILSHNQMANIVNAHPDEELNFLVATPIEKSIEIDLASSDMVSINGSESQLIRDIDFSDVSLGCTMRYGDTLVALEDLTAVNDTTPPLDDEDATDWNSVQCMVESGGVLEFDHVLEPREITITPVQDENSGTEKGLIGISPLSIWTPVNFFDSIKLGFQSIWNIFVAIWAFFLGLFKGKTAGIGGPVAIFSILSESSKFGIAKILTFMGYLSVMLGFVNLIPFPGLDGGHIMFNLFEGVSGKKIKRTVLNAINFVGFIILMGLMVLIIIRDIMNIF